MIISTSGFFGSYSVQLGNPEVGIPYMQPYSFNNGNSAPSFLPALNFASILEDKGRFDMTSKMKYEGTSFMAGTEMGRDYFLFSACNYLLSECACYCSVKSISAATCSSLLLVQALHLHVAQYSDEV